jgi:UDP-2,3-diacylglucosamine pyrophosphatase LpxH
MREIDGTLYCNDGDWVESLTALVEHHNGELEIVHWTPQIHALRQDQKIDQTVAA